MVEHMSEEHGVGSSILPSSTRNRSSVVEHSADNRAVTSSNLVGSTLEVWQRGLMQWIANPPMFLRASVGSNPTTSVGSVVQW